MIFLTTGANGAGKTLLTLKDVREQQLRENRPVYYHGFEADVSVIEGQFGWKPHDPEKWQDLPDGSILVWDECQIFLGAKKWGGKEPPEWVMALGKFRRKRGFDIWAVAPHPAELHVSFRRLIDNPSWHRHLKRAFGAQMVSVIKYGAPNLQCDKPGSGGVQGEVTMKPYPKEVYGWYKSASLHTAKRKLPRAVWVLLFCVVAVPALVYTVVWSLQRNVQANKERVKPGSSVVAAAPAGSGIGGGPGRPGSPRSSSAQRPIAEAQSDYLAARQPRLDGFPHTAQAFDRVTEPKAAPFPAACVDGRFAGKVKDCRCWTQQGTVLPVPKPVCEQIVANGFQEWRQDAGGDGGGRQSVVAGGSPVLAPVSAPAPAPAAVARDVPASGAGATGAPGPVQFSSRGNNAPVAFPSLVADGMDDAGAAARQARHDGSVIGAMRAR